MTDHRCVVSGCAHPTRRWFEWDTPEGEKELAFCSRHGEYAARSKNSVEVTP